MQAQGPSGIRMPWTILAYRSKTKGSNGVLEWIAQTHAYESSRKGGTRAGARKPKPLEHRKVFQHSSVVLVRSPVVPAQGFRKVLVYLISSSQNCLHGVDEPLLVVKGHAETLQLKRGLKQGPSPA